MGCSAESLIQLRGGINNYVFRCGTQGRHLVIKGYPTYQAGQRDRMQAELEFLRYAHLVAPGRVPELMAVDNDRRCVVLEYVEGSPYPEGTSPSAEDVQEAVSFFRLLNADLGLARQMIQLDAAEGFLSLRQHMANVRERLAAMGTEHLPAEFRPKAAVLLVQLQRHADRIENDLEAMIVAGRVEDRLDPEQRCVSPSDFGFHNAIRTDQGVTFIDFEFAGWDDPAKACIDFVLQPNVPVRNTTSSPALALLLEPWESAHERIISVAKILQLKWLCIILSIFQPERIEFMKAIHSEFDIESVVRSRLLNAYSRFRAFEKSGF
jgi:hypothetical protein